MQYRSLFLLTLAFVGLSAQAQNSKEYWQQHVDYTMDVDMDVDDYNYTGSQELKYTNNSPDTLHQVFYHLYFNAFQPESEMNARLKDIKDPDGRMANNVGTEKNPEYESRISDLDASETGFLKVKSLKQDGDKVNFLSEGTILRVDLDSPVLPGESTVLEMEFKGQVPQQIRRSGRNNAEGVEFSMTQWYPKLAEYDYQGWHPDQYIAREFYGVWGDFDVKITIDSDYVLGGSGYLQNPNEIGYNYQDEGVEVERDSDKLTWHFKAPKVHDFTWAADKEFIHDKHVAEDGTVMHFLYKDNDEIKENWKKLQPKAEDLLMFYNKHIGQYPYDQYSIIQGGDGGMEYAMSTLITGERNFGSLVGVTAHEFAHSWFQFVLATNESTNEWMDEGFTSYISGLAEDEVLQINSANPFESSYRNYVYLANSGAEQPQTTHADRYNVNMAYGIAAYSKGAIFLRQLEYVIGQDKVDETLKRYFDEWQFKHPTPNDFIRVAEKVSGAQLSWYLREWTKTTNSIDYAITDVSASSEQKNATKVTLERKKLMPMPVEVKASFKDGSEEMYYIPLRMMYWKKDIDGKTLDEWAWGFPTYDFTIDRAESEIEKLEIDPSKKMADTDRDNNTYQN